MSHFVNYQMQLKEEKSLISALKDLEYAVGKDAEINGWGRQKRRVDIAAKKGDKQHIGFNRQGDSFDAVADWMYIPKGERERIQQQYSKHEVLDALKKSRFSVKSVEEKDGNIVLVGVRN